MQDGIGGQTNGDRADPGSLGWCQAWLSDSLSAACCVGIHCSAGSAGSCWWVAFGPSQWSTRPVGDHSSWLFATVCGRDADALIEEIPWASRGHGLPEEVFGELLCDATSSSDPPNTLLRWGGAGRWWWSRWLCGWGGRTAWTLTLLSPAGPGPPLLKQLLSLTVGLCKYSCGPLSRSFFFVAWVTAGSPPWLPCSAPPHTVDASEIYHDPAFPRGSWARAKVVTFSLLHVAAPTWEACPGSSSQRWGMQWVFVHLSCHFTILFCFQQFFDAVSTVSTWRIISSTKR